MIAFQLDDTFFEEIDFQVVQRLFDSDCIHEQLTNWFQHKKEWWEVIGAKVAQRTPFHGILGHEVSTKAEVTTVKEMESKIRSNKRQPLRTRDD